MRGESGLKPPKPPPPHVYTLGIPIPSIIDDFYLSCSYAQAHEAEQV